MTICHWAQVIAADFSRLQESVIDQLLVKLRSERIQQLFRALVLPPPRPRHTHQLLLQAALSRQAPGQTPLAGAVALAASRRTERRARVAARLVSLSTAASSPPPPLAARPRPRRAAAGPGDPAAPPPLLPAR